MRMHTDCMTKSFVFKMHTDLYNTLHLQRLYLCELKKSMFYGYICVDPDKATLGSHKTKDSKGGS